MRNTINTTIAILDSPPLPVILRRLSGRIPKKWEPGKLLVQVGHSLLSRVINHRGMFEDSSLKTWNPQELAEVIYWAKKNRQASGTCGAKGFVTLSSPAHILAVFYLRRMIRLVKIEHPIVVRLVIRFRYKDGHKTYSASTRTILRSVSFMAHY